MVMLNGSLMPSKYNVQMKYLQILRSEVEWDNNVRHVLWPSCVGHCVVPPGPGPGGHWSLWSHVTLHYCCHTYSGSTLDQTHF